MIAPPAMTLQVMVTLTWQATLAGMGSAPPHEPVGSLLRQWRQLRRLSQQALADRADVSTRHLSCVETGRARPTAAMIERLADHLEIPPQERNTLLLAGGFAPHYGHRPLDDAVLAPVLDGLRALLDAHAPYPALLIDDRWELVDANAPAYALRPPVNVVRMSLQEQGFGRLVRNRGQLAAALLLRVQHRAERLGDPALLALAAEVAAYVGPRAPAPALPGALGPVLTIELAVGDRTLRLCTVEAQLQGATDATLARLHLETFLPADAATQVWLSEQAIVAAT